MSGSIDFAVLTHSPSPYQVELFNAVSALSDRPLTAVYLYSQDPSRLWADLPISHRAIYGNSNAVETAEASDAIMQADLAIMNYYTHPLARRLLAARAGQKRPWVFWGERPGYRLPLLLGRLARKWNLRSLHSSNAAIWGIGRLAVENYREEFGNTRSYHNIPYFSDLDRFKAISRDTAAPESPRTFLFSGSLTNRKGIDLLVRAFVTLAAEEPNVRLKIMGTGPLLDQLMAKTSSISDRLEFLGFKDWAELPEVYASADILCVPSRYDGWGLVVPEGLAAGMPVIVTDQTGAGVEFIETGRNGWLVRAGDEGSLLSAMREAARLPPERLQELSANARSSVKEHSLRHGAERFLAAAQEAVSEWCA